MAITLPVGALTLPFQQPAQAVDFAASLARSKLTGPLRTVADFGDILLRRLNRGSISDFSPVNQPGRHDPLQGAKGRDDPLLSFNWWVDMPILWDNSVLDWSMIEEASLPLIEFGTISNYRAGKEYHYAGHYSLGGLSLKFYEDRKGTATKYLQSWKGAILDSSTSTYQTPNRYKYPIAVTVLDAANLTVMFFKYTGCWIEKQGTIPLTSGDSSRIIVEADFVVDDVQVDFGTFSESSIPSIIGQVGSSLNLAQFLPTSLPQAFQTFKNLI